MENHCKQIANDKNKGAKITGRHNDSKEKSFSFTSSKNEEEVCSIVFKEIEKMTREKFLDYLHVPFLPTLPQLSFSKKKSEEMKKVFFSL